MIIIILVLKAFKISWALYLAHKESMKVYANGTLR